MLWKDSTVSNILDKFMDGLDTSEDRSPKVKRAEDHKKKVKKHNKQRRQRARDNHQDSY